MGGADMSGRGEAVDTSQGPSLQGADLHKPIPAEEADRRHHARHRRRDPRHPVRPLRDPGRLGGCELITSSLTDVPSCGPVPSVTLPNMDFTCDVKLLNAFGDEIEQHVVPLPDADYALPLQ